MVGAPVGPAAGQRPTGTRTGTVIAPSVGKMRKRTAKSVQKLEKPEWQRFEEEVSLLAEAFGYRAEATRPTGDGGLDVVAYGRRGKVIIQCKLLGRNKVCGPTIAQLVGTRVLEEAAYAMCVTTSGFTRQAMEFAAASEIVLLDADKLLAMCRRKHLTLPSLTVLLGPSAERIPLPSPRMTLGRSSGCDIVLDDPAVSRRHAMFERTGLQLRLSDCGSTNGTRVNGRPLVGPCLLNYGDRLRFGPCELEVSFHPPNAEPPSSTG
jgi:restriction endonuclease/FHA domain-containing protein